MHDPWMKNPGEGERERERERDQNCDSDAQSTDEDAMRERCMIHGLRSH